MLLLSFGHLRGHLLCPASELGDMIVEDFDLGFIVGGQVSSSEFALLEHPVFSF